MIEGHLAGGDGGHEGSLVGEQVGRLLMTVLGLMGMDAGPIVLGVMMA